MKFWNYIGESFLFRWLFNKLHNTEDNDAPNGKPSDYRGYSSNSHSSNRYHGNSQSYHDFHEEQDDYDMIDDF